MFCTTCGHMLFRYGLREIAPGADPNSSSWLVTESRPALRGGLPLPELGPIPGFGPWPIDEQRRLTAVAQGADLKIVAASAPFPDWLGYLGLVLHYTEQAELEDLGLTRSWAPQLAQMVRHGSEAHGLLKVLSSDNGLPLTWRLLEKVERSVRSR